ncbi:MAG: rane protein [Rhodoglobus sp.]|nr:rane protein [Rhodoglobus sp.]
MYAALWRILPGPVWLRLIIALVLIAAAVAALMLWVFPWVLPFVSTQDATVQQ